MRFPFIRVALLMLACATSAAQAADETEYYVAEATGTLQVDAEGRVTDVALESAAGADVVKPFERRVARWRFAPVLEAGTAVPVEVRVNLTLSAALPAGQTRATVGVQEAKFFEPQEADPDFPTHQRNTMKAPAYPRRPYEHDVAGRLLMLVELDDAGVPRRTAVRSGWITGTPMSSSRAVEGYQRMLADAIASVVPEWRFPDQAGQRCVLVPVSFNLGSGWRRARRAVPDPAEWTMQDGCQPGETDSRGTPVSQRIVLLTPLDPLIP
jgi:hypothetical protein